MALPPPSPVNFLRGHDSPIHATAFVRGNQRLATGDANGCVILWDLSIMRPRAVWQAHENAILAIRGWGHDKIITHGRDQRLIVWQLRSTDETNLKTVLPLEQSSDALPKPWVLHVLQVNTMNFCAFAACSHTPGTGPELDPELSDDASSILIAVPNTLLAESIDIFQLPGQKRIHTVSPGAKHGMAMTLSIFYKDFKLVLIAGFENGACSVFVLDDNSQEWSTTYLNQTHSKPVLSIGVNLGGVFFFSSAADALIVKHPVPLTLADSDPLLAATEPGSSTRRASSKPWQDAVKVVNTKHSGQQGLTMRSDGRLFATAGWDAKVRVYGAKSLKELAVLKWHQVGVYAVAFARVQEAEAEAEQQGKQQGRPWEDTALKGGGEEEEEVQDKSPAVQSKNRLERRPLSTAGERRMHRAKYALWIAAGSKDGKVSLWDLY